MSQGSYLILGLQTLSLHQDGSIHTGQGGISCPGVEKSHSSILNCQTQGSPLQAVLRFWQLPVLFKAHGC